MNENNPILIKGRSGEQIHIRRASANGPEGWFDTEVEVHCDGWRGKFIASFMQGELQGLALGLRTIHEHLVGQAVFTPLEPNLELSFTGDGKGHIEVKGSARNNFHTETKLSFRLAVDQTDLPAIAKALADMDP
jgi:hypothetical protein